MAEFAKVFWVVDDILLHAEDQGIPITEEEAKEFLEEYEEWIAERMVETGWAVIDNRFFEEFGDRKPDDAA